MNSLKLILWTSLKLALRQLLRHKVRSFLTMLGIFIGVGGVVAIVSLGEGLRGFFVQSMAAQASSDLVYIMPDAPFRPGGMQTVEKPFKNRDLQAIRESEYVTAAIGGNIIENGLIKHGWRSERVMVMLAPHTYFPLDNWQLGRGRFYSTAEERGSQTVCVVGAEVDDALYDKGEEILGSFLTINGVRFEVVGEMKSRTALEGGPTSNKMVFVPLETGQARLLGSDDLWWMSAKIRSSDELSRAKEDIAARLRTTRRIRSGKEDDFNISTPDDWAAFGNNFVNTLIMVFGIVAVIALAVGGIGVMNIMLISVKERTREIGRRKARGATPGIITWQFLVDWPSATAWGPALR